MGACAIMMGIMVTEYHGEEMGSNIICRDMSHTSIEIRVISSVFRCGTMKNVH